MKSICNSCYYQEEDYKGNVRCSLAEYYSSHPGSFKQGSVCIHDDDLNDRFRLKGDTDSRSKELSKHVDRLQTELVSLRCENSILKERLIKVEE